jgi:hypothetical protein
MILSLIACIYISALCWTWGFGLLSILQRITRSNPHVAADLPVTCAAGLALLGILFTALSLFIPLGGLAAQGLVLVPAVLAWTFSQNLRFQFLVQLKDSLGRLGPATTILFCISLVLILILGAWTISHPDTLAYHAQCIRWIEEFRVVPGLANLHYHYGLQNSWFVLCALFSLKFTGTSALTYLNSTVLIWFIWFVHIRIRDCLILGRTDRRQTWKGFLWLSLLMIGFWSYTQIRLTASSASPDFISAVYIWLTFFLYAGCRPERPSAFELWLILFFGFFSLTLKLSSVPILLFSLFIYYRYCIKTAFRLLLPLILGTILLAPFLIRNGISSGYLFFPAERPDLIHAAWKVPRPLVSMKKNYITTYARTQSSSEKTEIERVMKMNYSQWIPIWWGQRSLADQFILSCLILLSGLGLFHWKLGWREGTSWILVFSILGTLFWFILAPDPRFGFGFIIPAESILLLWLGRRYISKFEMSARWLLFFLSLFGLSLAGYSIHRFQHYFKANDLIQPEGIPPLPFYTVVCAGGPVHMPLDGEHCGGIALPCTCDSCHQFSRRSSEIQDGFLPYSGESK